MARKLSDIANQVEFAPRAAGEYDLCIESVEPTNPSSGGHPQIKIETSFLEGRYAGKKTSLWRMTSEKMQWKLAKELTAAGFGNSIECPDTDDSAAWAQALREIVGARVKVRLDHREYNGKVREELTIIGGDPVGSDTLASAGV